jgi:hypothetical protein
VFDLININVVSNSKKKDKYYCRKVIEAANVILANVPRQHVSLLATLGMEGRRGRVGVAREGSFSRPEHFARHNLT